MTDAPKPPSQPPEKGVSPVILFGIVGLFAVVGIAAWLWAQTQAH
jgi:hypothetical protein